MRKPVGKASSQKKFPFSFAKCRPPSFPHEKDFDSWCCFPSLSFSCYVQLGKKVSTISSFFFRATNPFKKMRDSSWWFKKELRDPFFSQFFFVIVQLFTFGQTSKFQVALYSSDLNKMPSKSLFYALVPLVNLLQDNLFASSNITPRHMLPHMLKTKELHFLSRGHTDLPCQIWDLRPNIFWWKIYTYL